MNAFLESTKLLLQLHEEISTGRGDDEAADLIRDQMEPLWYAMTDDEREVARQLSAALYVADKSKNLSLPKL